MDSVETLKLNQLAKVSDKALDAKKNGLIFDKQGNCATFFQYSASLIDFDKEKMKVDAGM